MGAAEGNPPGIDGMQFLLCRNQDVFKPCCRNLAYYRNSKLWCIDCKRPRGQLSPKVIAGLLVILGVCPKIVKETHILRNKSELPDEAEASEPAADPVGGDTEPRVIPETSE